MKPRLAHREREELGDSKQNASRQIARYEFGIESVVSRNSNINCSLQSGWARRNDAFKTFATKLTVDLYVKSGHPADRKAGYKSSFLPRSSLLAQKSSLHLFFFLFLPSLVSTDWAGHKSTFAGENETRKEKKERSLAEKVLTLLFLKSRMSWLADGNGDASECENKLRPKRATSGRGCSHFLCPTNKLPGGIF